MAKMNNIEGVTNCFGCGACFLKCPKKAIKMEVNRLGQKQPEIDRNSCINCGICKGVCPAFHNISADETEIKSAYISVNTNDTMLMKSASGGISAALAYRWILNGGYVCGASGIAPSSVNEQFHVEHILLRSIEDIEKIQGSKYVQSDITKVLPEIENLLKQGSKILFFGTSCQVAGTKSYLGKNYENLVTCDLICHGVIGSQMFSNYLKHIERKEKNRLVDVSFRTKEREVPYTFTFTFTFTDKNNNHYKKLLDKNKSSYYRMFLGCIGYRKSCYECKFASVDKPSDITLGDYYEAKDDYPELFETGKLNMSKGISSVIIHSKKGRDLFAQCNEDICSYSVDVNKIVSSHAQLQKPSKSKKGSILILQLYKMFGWSGVDRFYMIFDRVMSWIRKSN